jgi:DNA-damage-inducible protein J
MSKTKRIRIRIEEDIKARAEAVFPETGLSPGEAVCAFYRRVALDGALPFDPRRPNRESLKSIRDVRAGRDVQTYKDFAELRKKLGI